MANDFHIPGFSFKQILHYQFVEKKLNTRFGYIFLTVFALLIGCATALLNLAVGPVLIILFLAVISIFAIGQNSLFGFYFLIFFSSITVFIDRLVSTPGSFFAVADVMTYFVFLTIFIKSDYRKNADARFWTNPVSIALYILFAYYILELFNPEMYSKVGWFHFFRRQISYFMFYYMSYVLLDSRKKIIDFIRFMIGLSSLFALYACKQQWLGYAGFELRSIGTGNGRALLMQAGLFRKFSVFSDPATSGVLFASIATLCIVLIFRSHSKKEKRWLGLATIINLLGYSYSGTRTATLMIMAGILVYGISTLYEPRTFRFLAVAVSAFILIMIIPSQNVVTNRIKSAFEGTRDASANLRDYDRHEVQPYIQAHPMGGGVYTCGFEGPKYNEGHYLEFFQPDSGFMKVLAEEGAIGFVLMLVFYFVVMRQGYYHFFRVKDPEIQNYYIALIAMMFTLLVGQISQLTIAQAPASIFFYATVVIFIKLADFDKETESLNKATLN